MQISTTKLPILVSLILFALTTACKIENLPVNANNSNANANAATKNSPAQNSTVSPQNTNAAQNQSVPANLPESNSAFPPYNSASSNVNSEIIVVSKLIIPVAGIKKEDLRDTFNDARSEGRTHNALDIMAAAGTPVLAATDGKIVRFHDSELGGITVYQLATDGRLVLYYAHLQSRAEGITENMDVKKGTVIGYVGDTGNAGAGNYHLHFAMWIVDDPKRYWEGANINPYQYLK
jgi:murein DD-endopeptidase MepM/ murein hydrolase activator NlpD